MAHEMHPAWCKYPSFDLTFMLVIYNCVKAMCAHSSIRHTCNAKHASGLVM